MYTFAYLKLHCVLTLMLPSMITMISACKYALCTTAKTCEGHSNYTSLYTLSNLKM